MNAWKEWPALLRAGELLIEAASNPVDVAAVRVGDAAREVGRSRKK